jgi:uncharacterized membrane protein
MIEFIDSSLNQSLTLAQSVPRMDGHYFLLLTSRVLHVLGSIILLGGIFYLLAVVAPRVVASGGRPDADAWFAGNRAAWAKWVGIATAVLLVTGLFNFITIIKANQIATSYHMLGGIKVLVALVIAFLAAILAGKTGLAERLRENMKFWLTVTMLVGLVIVVIGSMMRSYPRELKPVNGPALVAPNT